MLSAALLCLALNVYHEARGEPIEGQIAVAHVTNNRARNNPKNYCRVVYDRKQFSWTSAPGPVDKRSSAWQTAVAVAKSFKLFPDRSRGATFFHTVRAKPKWRHSMKLTQRIGNHVFYKET